MSATQLEADEPARTEERLWRQVGELVAALAYAQPLAVLALVIESLRRATRKSAYATSSSSFSSDGPL